MSNAYDILYGPAAGQIVREAHAKAIRLGNRLERLLVEKAKPSLRYSVEVAPILDKRKADILLWDRLENKLLIIEVMLSCNIDTGKVRARYAKLAELEGIYASHYPGWENKALVLSFGNTRREVVGSLKGNYFELQDVITAKMYSRIVELDFTIIRGVISKEEQRGNIQWLKESLAAI